MKKCCIGLCLLLVNYAVAESWREYERFSEGEVAHLRECFKSSEKLKESRMACFTSDHSLWAEEISLYIEKFNIAKDILRTALMEVIHESEMEAKWEPFRPNDPEDLTFDKRRLMQAITWLGRCADGPTKEFLMEVALDGTKGEVYRNMAVEAYIHAADAQQVKDALTRFLVETRVIPHSTYLFAVRTYEEAEGDKQKREAIIAALTAAALEREEDRGYFAEADAHFARQDKAYAKSPQRKEALKQMNLSPPSEPVGNKTPPWKLPLLVGTIIFGGVVVAWRYLKRRRN
jgi:hypothetical protein